jgi:hypothetical protein
LLSGCKCIPTRKIWAWNPQLIYFVSESSMESKWHVMIQVKACWKLINLTRTQRYQLVLVASPLRPKWRTLWFCFQNGRVGWWPNHRLLQLSLNW